MQKVDNKIYIRPILKGKDNYDVWSYAIKTNLEAIGALDSIISKKTVQKVLQSEASGGESKAPTLESKDSVEGSVAHAILAESAAVSARTDALHTAC